MERFYDGTTKAELKTVYKVMTRLEKNLEELKEEL